MTLHMILKGVTVTLQTFISPGGDTGLTLHFPLVFSMIVVVCFLQTNNLHLIVLDLQISHSFSKYIIVINLTSLVR